MAKHSEVSLGARHPIHNWEYANAGARTGASGFVAGDIGKVAKQIDDDTYYVLTATTPVWVEITGGGGGGGEANTSSNVGVGAGTLAKAKAGVDLPFKTIKAGANITINNLTNEVEIVGAAGSGEANTTSNAGAGAGTLAKAKAGVDLPIKTIKAGTGVTVTNNTNDVEIAIKHTPFYFAFKDKINSKNAAYTKKGGFIFPGTNVTGAIALVQAIVRVDDAAEAGDLRVWDATNSLVIAEITGETSEPDVIRSLTLTPANFPTTQAIFEFQLRCPSGGDDMNCMYIEISF